MHEQAADGSSLTMTMGIHTELTTAQFLARPGIKTPSVQALARFKGSSNPSNTQSKDVALNAVGTNRSEAEDVLVAHALSLT